MSYRQRLPNRRPALTERIEFAGRPYWISVGFDPRCGAVREVFAAGAQLGSDSDALIADAAVVLSLALQHGISAQALQLSLARVPHVIDGPAVLPASILGALIDLVVTIERGAAERGAAERGAAERGAIERGAR